ncbi:MAG: hypothetical protein HQL46_13270 [Gammaproteobacteria bacterium]|nr:hypothetical protein [Gammaproteobacteria bacterium]
MYKTIFCQISPFISDTDVSFVANDKVNNNADNIEHALRQMVESIYQQKKLSSLSLANEPSQLLVNISTAVDNFNLSDYERIITSLKTLYDSKIEIIAFNVMKDELGQDIELTIIAQYKFQIDSDLLPKSHD